MTANVLKTSGHMVEDYYQMLESGINQYNK